MAKIALILVLVGVFITVQGLPATYDEILAAARDQLQGLLHSQFGKEALKKPTAFDSVRNLKPLEGGQVYGEAEYAFHSASNINGKTKEDFGGHKLINNNGKVKEFDFTPSTVAPIGLLKFNSDGSNLKPLIGTPFVEPDYSFLGGTGFDAKNPGYAGIQASSNKTPITPKLPLPALAFSGLPDLKTAQLGVNPIAFAGVRDLKPGKDSHVYGEAEYTFHSASNINGKKIEDHAGHKIINNDGKIKEFDFTPSPDFTDKFPLSILNKGLSDLKKMFDI